MDLSIPILVILAIAGIAALASVINGGLGHRHMTFVGERYGAGSLPHEIGRELRLRHAAAALRRRASHAVLRAPRRHAEIIRSMAKDEALKIAAFDRSMAKQFLQWAEGAELSEILYPAAMRAVWKGRKRHRHVDLHPDARRDLHAALKISG